MPLPLNTASYRTIGACMRLHRRLGPGLLESVYQACLPIELARAGLSYVEQSPVVVDYEGVHVTCGYRVDFIIEEAVLLELKSVAAIAPIHEAQVITYLKLTGLPLGLLINFNVPLLKEGIYRRLNPDADLEEVDGVLRPKTEQRRKVLQR